jgi:hypothetical protein
VDYGASQWVIVKFKDLFEKIWNEKYFFLKFWGSYVKICGLKI